MHRSSIPTLACACVLFVAWHGKKQAAADRRRLFPEGELRDTLDGFTDTITKRQRNPGGLMAPPARTVGDEMVESHRITFEWQGRKRQAVTAVKKSWRSTVRDVLYGMFSRGKMRQNVVVQTQPEGRAPPKEFPDANVNGMQ